MVTRTQWVGVVKAYDDTGKPIINSFIDGRTIMGPWAIMTPETHHAIGVGLGVGKGQLYRRHPVDDVWYKING